MIIRTHDSTHTQTGEINDSTHHKQVKSPLTVSTVDSTQTGEIAVGRQRQYAHVYETGEINDSAHIGESMIVHKPVNQ